MYIFYTNFFFYQGYMDFRNVLLNLYFLHVTNSLLVNFLRFIPTKVKINVHRTS